MHARWVSRPAGAVQVIESMPRTAVEAGETSQLSWKRWCELWGADRGDDVVGRRGQRHEPRAAGAVGDEHAVRDEASFRQRRTARLRGFGFAFAIVARVRLLAASRRSDGTAPAQSNAHTRTVGMSSNACLMSPRFRARVLLTTKKMPCGTPKPSTYRFMLSYD